MWRPLVLKRMIGRKPVYALVMIAAAVPLRAAANDPFEQVREMIRKALVEEQVPSIAVGVARNGKIIWEEGFGWADRENRLAATEHTMYSLASVSKPLTATGLMVLVERKQIDLDRPVNDYLGDAKLKAWVGNASDATVRRVANHSAGLPLHYQFFYEDEPYKAPPMDETIRRYGNLVWAPGETYEYSNLGYGILGYIIERVSGRSLSDFVRQEVFLPLGMSRSSLNIGPRLEKHHAVRYGTDRLPIMFYDFDHPGASAFYASAHDLLRFGMFHLKTRLPDQKAILSDRAIDQMQEPTVRQEDSRNGYGIGWGTTDLPRGNRRVGHGGGMHGVSTVLSLIPSEKLAVVALANTNSDLPTRVRDKIVDSVLLPQTVEPEQRRSPERPPEPESSQARQLPREILGKWTGTVHTYKATMPFTLWILESGDVHAQLGSQLKTLLNGARVGQLYVRGRMTGDIGTEDANRKPYYLELTLRRRGNLLNGAITALSLAGRRARNALSHWVELKKEGN